MEKVLNVEGLFDELLFDGGLELYQCGLIIRRNLQHILKLFKSYLNKFEVKRFYFIQFLNEKAVTPILCMFVGIVLYCSNCEGILQMIVHADKLDIITGSVQSTNHVIQRSHRQ